MKQRSIKFIAALLGATMLFAACDKNNDALLGKWGNTAQSYEITIGGQEYLPEGCICMEFTDNKVKMSDSRRDCLTEYRYKLSEKDGKQLLEIKGNGGCFAGQIFVVEELTSDKLVLAPRTQIIDWDFRYIMKRP
jgi:hypothetical protein